MVKEAREKRKKEIAIYLEKKKRELMAKKAKPPALRKKLKHDRSDSSIDSQDKTNCEITDDYFGSDYEDE